MAIREDLGRPLDVNALLDEGAWSGLGKLAVAFAAVALVIDGFDNQALGFALPSIIKEWGLERAAFAPVVAIGLVGMTLGAGLGGLFGDRVGRRTALLSSLFLFGLATAATIGVANIQALGILRFFAGAGIGAALPNAAAIAAEFTPRRHRPLAVMLTIVCVPLGGMAGGLIAAAMVPVYGWRSLFLIGGGAPLAMASVLLFLLPESPRFLSLRPGRWPELAQLLTRLGFVTPKDQVFELAAAEAEDHAGRGLSSLLAPFYRRDTLTLWSAFFFCLFAVYSVFNWAPTILASGGLSVAAASNATAAYNFGGVIGAVGCAAVLGRTGSRAVLPVLAILAAGSALVLVALPTRSGDNVGPLVLALGVHGLFTNAVQTSMYALAAHVYATKLRSTGAGAALSIGRLGAILGAYSGAAVVSVGPKGFYALLAAAMIGNAICLLFVKRHIPGRTD